MSEMTECNPVPVVVLAGGKAKPDLEALTGQTNRALIVVNGKTLLSAIVDAVGSSRVCGPILTVGGVPESERYRRAPDTGDFVENLFSGISAFADAPFVLISTSDLPFLTGESVAAFVKGATALASDPRVGLVYPVVPVAACYARFPGVRRTSLKLREGELTGGNMMLVRPAFLLDKRAVIAGAYAGRKSPLRLASMLGPAMIVRLLLSQKVSPRLLSVATLERRVSRLLGVGARALVCDYPEIATDLDRPSDFAAVGLEPQGKTL